MCLLNAAGPGLLYLFANDLWHTAANNSGAVRLQIERVEQPVTGAPLWRLKEDGYWKKDELIVPYRASEGMVRAGLFEVERV